MSSLDLVCIWPPLLGLGSKFHQKYSIYLDQCSEMLMSGWRDTDTMAATFSLLAIPTLGMAILWHHFHLCQYL